MEKFSRLKSQNNFNQPDDEIKYEDEYLKIISYEVKFKSIKRLFIRN